MDIRTADDIQLLVEDFGWNRTHSVAETAVLLKEINAESNKQIQTLIDQRVWDETFDDEMAASARFEAALRWTRFDGAIQAWIKGKLND